MPVRGEVLDSELTEVSIEHSWHRAAANIRRMALEQPLRKIAAKRLEEVYQEQ